MLRGVYLISATQEGIPINHLPTHLPTEKHNNRQTINTGETRGYFIKKFNGKSCSSKGINFQL